MNAILLIAGLFFFWIWLRGHPIGAVVAFLLAIFTGAPAILGVDSLPLYLGYSAAFALAPIIVLWLWRDLSKGRDSRLAHFGNAMLDGLAPPKAQKPDVVWSKADLEAWSRTGCEPKEPDDLTLSAEERQLRRGAELLGIDWQEMLRARVQSSSLPS